MAASHSIAGLLKWLNREEWLASFSRHLDSHLEPACTKVGIEPDDLESVLGHGLYMNIWGCAFEDFASREAAASNYDLRWIWEALGIADLRR